MTPFSIMSLFRHALAVFIALTMACGADHCRSWIYVGGDCVFICATDHFCVMHADSHDQLAASHSPSDSVHHADGGACTCSGHVPIVIPTPVMMWVGINGVVRILLPDSSTMPEK